MDAEREVAGARSRLRGKWCFGARGEEDKRGMEMRETVGRAGVFEFRRYKRAGAPAGNGCSSWELAGPTHWALSVRALIGHMGRPQIKEGIEAGA
jgi:hypothetical protein